MAAAVQAVAPGLVAQLVYGLARGAVWPVDGLWRGLGLIDRDGVHSPSTGRTACLGSVISP